MNEFDKKVMEAVNNVIGDVVVKRLTEYNSPLYPIIDSVIKNNESMLKTMFGEAFALTITADEFKQSLKNAFTHKVSRAVVDLLIGKIDNAVNVIKSDQTLKARMVLAIENIIKEIEVKKV